jgi:hypothetical protein
MDMTTSVDTELINEALAIIDRGLGQLMHRELVSTAEAADLLLDVRSLLAGADGIEDFEPIPVSN